MSVESKIVLFFTLLLVCTCSAGWFNLSFPPVQTESTPTTMSLFESTLLARVIKPTTQAVLTSQSTVSTTQLLGLNESTTTSKAASENLDPLLSSNEGNVSTTQLLALNESTTEVVEKLDPTLSSKQGNVSTTQLLAETTEVEENLDPLLRRNEGNQSSSTEVSSTLNETLHEKEYIKFAQLPSSGKTASKEITLFFLASSLIFLK